MSWIVWGVLNTILKDISSYNVSLIFNKLFYYKREQELAINQSRKYLANLKGQEDEREENDKVFFRVI